ncbi:MAG: ABC transporter substrate-binding protein [Deltaproteobacteria bacterium]|nr:ABC transporter substrate-binding protein [Deltaproteobacteria bacterium]MBW2306172.1 ABC transporter substrate-binding protein [Deltaproteobacteria bacterium]
MRMLVAVLVILAMMVIVQSPAVAGKKDNTLNIAWEKELETLDFYFQTAREGTILSRHVYDSLLYRDPDTWEYKPLLAKSFKWIDDVTIEVELRKGVAFHNGDKFDADDVVYTLNFVSNPKNKVLAQRNVNWIKNAEKLGPYKVRINLHKPFPVALEYLSGQTPIYPKEYYAKVGPKVFGVRPVGTGPYKVVKVVPGKAITMVKNDDYFDGSPKGKPFIGKINQRTIPEVTTKVAELITGNLDWIWLVPKDQAEKLAKMPNLQVDFAETMRVGFLYFNCVGDTPFKNIKVRQAVAHAIDREAIVKNLVGGSSRVVHSVCYPTQFGCTDEGVVKYEYDPEKAKKLLAEAGYPDGFEFNFHAYRERPYAEATIGYLHAVGLKPKLVYMKYAAMREKWQGNKVPLAFWTWGSYSVNDISAITGHWFKFEIDDFARDPQVRDWLETGDTSIDPQVRKTAYKKALKRISERLYALPMFTWVTNTAYSKDLEYKAYPDEIPRFFLTKWK